MVKGSVMATHRLMIRGTTMLMLTLCVGCGGSQPTSPAKSTTSVEAATLDAAFIARADKVCAPYLKYNHEHTLELPGFSRYSPDPATLPAVAEYLSHNPAYRTLVPSLRSLGAPTSGSAAWDAFVDDLSEGQALVAQLTTRARRSDDAGFVKISSQLDANQASLHGELPKLGLSASSSCYGAQIDVLRAPPAVG